MATTIVITPPPADPVTVGVTPPAPTTTTIVLNETIPAGVPTGGATGQVLAKTSGADYATAWVDQTGGGGGGGATDLTFTRNGTTVTVESSTGTDAVLPAATTSLAGVLTGADKTKLDGIATGATANSPDATLLARANHTGTQAAATITGLAATATSTDAANLTGTLAAARIADGSLSIAKTSGLQTALDGKAATSHTHTASQVTDFNSATRAQVEAALIAGANITITPAGTGATRTLTIASSGGGGGAGLHIGDTAPASPTANPLWWRSDIGELFVWYEDGSSNQWVSSGGGSITTGGGGGGATNLTFTRDGTTVTIESDTGTDAILPAATTSLAGVLSAADKTKLDGIATGATANSTDAVLLARANHTGTQAASTITGTFAIGNIPVAASGVSSATLVVRADDSRLSDARTPTSHTHGNITNVGAIGSTANLPVITGASGVLSTGTFGSTANTFCQGNDARLSDARTPTAHTHTAAQITDFGSATDTRVISYLESTLGGGVFDVASPAVGQVLKWDGGVWTNQADSTGGGGGATNLTYDAATRVIASDTGTDATLPLMSSGNAGLVPASGGGTTNFLRADGTFAAPPGGGGGSPGGTTGEIQYNNAGAFAGAANVEVEGGNLRLVATTEPAPPAAGGLLLFAQSLAGRIMPKFIGPFGIGTILQESLSGNAVLIVSASSGSNAPTVLGGTITTTITMSLAQVANSTNLWFTVLKKRFQTNTTAGNATGMRTSYTQWVRSATAGAGGWFFRAQFGTSINEAVSHKFIGLCQQITVLNNEPSALVHMIGMGHDSTDANTGNWFLMHNDGSGTATKIDLGTNAARNTTDGYDLIMFCPPGPGSQIFVLIVNIRTGVVVYNSSVSTDLPAVGTALAFKGEARNGVATADNLEFAKVYISSDY